MGRFSNKLNQKTLKEKAQYVKVGRKQNNDRMLNKQESHKIVKEKPETLIKLQDKYVSKNWLKKRKTKHTEIDLTLEKEKFLESNTLNWPIVKLGDICDFFGGYAFKSENLREEKLDENYFPVIKIGNLNTSGSLDFSTVHFFKYSKKVENVLIRKEDILIAMTGATVGKVSISDYDNLLLNQRVGLVRANKKINQHFLLYTLLNEKFYNYCQENAEGGAQGNISPQKIKNFHVLCPPMEEQKKIAGVLFQIQKAIEVQDKLIKSTTELKKTTMKHLFTYGTKQEKTKQTEIGQIPKSWHITNLENICSFKYGKPLKKSDRKVGEYPVFGSNGIVGYHSKYLVKGPCIIVGRKGTAGEVTYSENHCYPIDTTFFINLKNKGECHIKYLYFVMCTLGLKKLKTKSNVPGLNRNDAYKLKIFLPQYGEQKEIVGILQKIDEKIEVHQNKKIALNELFKTMLQKLMTGQIHNLNIQSTLKLNATTREG